MQRRPGLPDGLAPMLAALAAFFGVLIVGAICGAAAGIWLFQN